VVGPRVFTLEEANELIPFFEESFGEIDDFRERMKAVKVKLNALEMIWGLEINDSDCPDRREGLALIEQLKELQEKVGKIIEQFAEEGATVKDVQGGLADLYSVREGRLVFLCWKRGEEEFEAWHHVDEGFADRQGL
jgi:hypothetical protein